MHIKTQLAATIDAALAPLIHGRNERLCIIDPPDHSNVGDCAIFLGELDFLERIGGISDSIFYDFRSYSTGCEKHIENSSIILMHGGGNFGDIWPHHHNFRLHIIEKFKNKPIIQFPQSIHFDSDDDLNLTKSVINSHRNFTLAVRDKKSFSFARQHFECQVILCPDMAFAMQPIVRHPASHDVTWLLRTDKEVVSDHAEIIESLRRSELKGIGGDWLEEPRNFVRRLDSCLSSLTRRHPDVMSRVQSLQLLVRRRYAQNRLRAGVRMLSRGNVVVTDRLHAHILSTLLGIPNVCFDSYDGKISAMYETWTRECGIATMISDVKELPAAVMRHLDQVAVTNP